VQLAFAGASTPQDRRAMDQVMEERGGQPFAAAWLEHKGLAWAADLTRKFPTAKERP
jgi:type IV secretion system protein VirB4